MQLGSRETALVLKLSQHVLQASPIKDANDAIDVDMPLAKLLEKAMRLVRKHSQSSEEYVEEEALGEPESQRVSQGAIRKLVIG